MKTYALPRLSTMFLLLMHSRFLLKRYIKVNKEIKNLLHSFDDTISTSKENCFGRKLISWVLITIKLLARYNVKNVWRVNKRDRIPWYLIIIQFEQLLLLLQQPKKSRKAEKKKKEIRFPLKKCQNKENILINVKTDLKINKSQERKWDTRDYYPRILVLCCLRDKEQELNHCQKH